MYGAKIVARESYMVTLEQELVALGLEVYSQNFSAKRLVTVDTQVWSNGVCRKAMCLR